MSDRLRKICNEYVSEHSELIEAILNDGRISSDDRIKVIAALAGACVGSFAGFIEYHQLVHGKEPMTQNDSFERAMVLIRRSVLSVS